MRPNAASLNAISLATVALAGFSIPLVAGGSRGEVGDQCALVDLCSALETVQSGEVIPLVVSGVYAVGQELQLLYDPERPQCDGNVQPSTWVEVSPQAGANPDLDRVLKKSRRALVVVRGKLYGPKQLTPDDTSLPVNLAYANRVAERRYGHLGAFRTKFFVEDILKVDAVPDSLPWAAVWHEAPDASGRVAVEFGELPQYPPRAQRVGLSGDVIVEFSVEGGLVSTVSVVSGDRLLAEAAVANVKSWRFDSQLQARLTTVFSFKLERSSRDRFEGTRVIAELPKHVTLIAPRDDW